MLRQAVLFLIDTQGTPFVGCYAGDPALGTPNLDRLAASGLRFDKAYTTSPVCGPARAALFTGLPPHANGVIANDLAPAINCPTLGQRLAPTGLTCGYIGKWHLDGTDYFGDGRCPPGWAPHYWFDGRNYLESLTPAERVATRLEHDAASVAAHGITAEFTHAHRTADRARAFLAEHRDRDFLLVVSIDEPHHPFICPEPFVSAFEDFELEVLNADDDLTTKPAQQRDWAAHSTRGNARRLRRDATGRTWLRHPRFFGCNSYSDHEVGRVLDAIDAHTPNALVITTSDHGDMFGHHRLSSKGPCVYEEIARVPFIVRWPGYVPPGTTTTALASHLDLVPTLLEFFGVTPPPILPGHSLLPILREPTRSVQDHVFMEFNRFEVDHDGFGGVMPIRAVTDGRWKLAVNLLDTDELYDLATDPHELINRLNDPAVAPVRDALHDVLLERMGFTRDPGRGIPWRRRPWRDLGGSTWGGPTRPRPFDPDFYPPTLLYDTAEPVDRRIYDKS